MEREEKISAVYESLPFGSQKKIAELAGTSRLSVRRFFQGKLKNLEKIKAITKATLKLYEEIQNQQSELINILER